MPETVGLITYHYPHLKTEQLLLRLLGGPWRLRLYALPFVPRPPRAVAVAHRPDQREAVAPEVLAQAHGLPYQVCPDDTAIDQACDVYLLAGAPRLSAACVAGKRILNCHPGLLPQVRGLDAFKWAIYEGLPLGVTLHEVTAELDAGPIVAQVRTPVYVTDSLTTLARRHYELELATLAAFDVLTAGPRPEPGPGPPGPLRRRMPLGGERELLRQCSDYTAYYGTQEAADG